MKDFWALKFTLTVSTFFTLKNQHYRWLVTIIRKQKNSFSGLTEKVPIEINDVEIETNDASIRLTQTISLSWFRGRWKICLQRSTSNDYLK